MAKPTIKIIAAASLFVLAVTVTAGCETSAIKPKQIVCAGMDVRAECLLERARDSHVAIADPFDWTTSANELAIAYDAMGQPRKVHELIAEAIDKSEEITDETRRETAASELTLSFSKLTRSTKGLDLIDRLTAINISSDDKRADINAKLVTARGVHGHLSEAARMAESLPGITDSEDTCRDRTIREIAALTAKSGQYDDAIQLARRINVRFSYYRGIAMTDIMAVAAKAGRSDIVEDLAPEAEIVAVSQENGYFAAGILRDIAYAMILTGNTSEARDYINRAKKVAKSAPKFQEQARSLSRITTRLADAGWSETSAPDLQEALSLARQEQSARVLPS